MVASSRGLGGRFSRDRAATIATIPIGKGMAGIAVERGRPVDACNIQTDASGNVRPGARSTGLSGAVVVPIFRGDEIIGALGIGTKRERAFTESETQLLIAEGRRLLKDGESRV